MSGPSPVLIHKLWFYWIVLRLFALVFCCCKANYPKICQLKIICITSQPVWVRKLDMSAPRASDSGSFQSLPSGFQPGLQTPQDSAGGNHFQVHSGGLLWRHRSLLAPGQWLLQNDVLLLSLPSEKDFRLREGERMGERDLWEPEEFYSLI